MVQLQVLIIEQSTISTERQCITPLPRTTTGATDHLVVSVTLAHTTVFTASGGQPTQLTVLVDWFADPVDSRVTPHSLVEWVHHDDFKVFVCGIFSHPVGVENTQAATVTTSTLLKQKAKDPRFSHKLTWFSDSPRSLALTPYSPKQPSADARSTMSIYAQLSSYIALCYCLRAKIHCCVLCDTTRDLLQCTTPTSDHLRIALVMSLLSILAKHNFTLSR